MKKNDVKNIACIIFDILLLFLLMKVTSLIFIPFFLYCSNRIQYCTACVSVLGDGGRSKKVPRPLQENKIFREGQNVG